VCLSIAVLLLFLAACGSDAEPVASPEQEVPTELAEPDENRVAPADELGYTLELPPGFQMTQYAADLGETRKTAFDDEGVLYVTIMERTRPGEGKLLALPDRDDDGKADEVITVLDQLDRPHGLVYHEGELYVSDPGNIYRIIDEDGDLQAEDTEIIVSNMPTQDDHWARPFTFAPDGTILVAIGSSCNATCTETDPRRATIYRYAPDGSEIGIVSSGLRSVVDMAWQPDSDNLWAVNNGRDWLGPEQPPDSAHIIREGAHYGWPFCFANGVVDEEVAARDTPAPPDGMSSEEFCSTQVTPGDMILPPHVAPLGVTFYTAEQFPEAWQGGMFMAWHGAFDFSNTNGYRVVYVPFENGEPQEPETFINWLMPDESGWFGRPVGVTVGPEGSLYVTDDVNGDIVQVSYVGE
jgi:glucose/arabinose dehydrogenase